MCVLKLIWCSIILLLVFDTQYTDALRCYACTWTVSSGDPDCITDPISVEGQNIVTCAKKYCTILRQELLDPPGKINSFSRSCEESPLFLNDVVEDSTFKTYLRSCTTDLCNAGDGLSNGGSAVSADGGPRENLLVPGLLNSAIPFVLNFVVFAVVLIHNILNFF